jgi:DNA polymerase-4
MRPGEGRRIGHLDMDAFFAAAEQLDRPEYRGGPVIVGGLGPRGVVSTASYEARVFGIHSAMPMAVARRRCPGGIYLPPRFQRYKEIADVVRGILRRYSPIVETVSLDEAFFDLSAHGPDFDAAAVVAREIKQRVRRETKLTCSVGLAPNRFLAKLASELNKPDGFLVIEPGRVQELLDPLPIARIPGVGKVTERRLSGLGLLRVRDLRRAPLELLVREFGSGGRRLQQLACGIDETPLDGEAESKTISREVTFSFDVAESTEIEREVRRLAQDVVLQLQAESLVCRTVRIKVRYPDFRTITRQTRLGSGTDSVRLIEALAVHLLRDRARLDERGIRLVGVGVGSLSTTNERQLSLFREFDSPAQTPRC